MTGLLVLAPFVIIVGYALWEIKRDWRDRHERRYWHRIWRRRFGDDDIEL